MNGDKNYTHKYYEQFLSSKNHEDVSFGSDYDLVEQRFCRNENYFGFTIQ